MMSGTRHHAEKRGAKVVVPKVKRRIDVPKRKNIVNGYTNPGFLLWTISFSVFAALLRIMRFICLLVTPSLQPYSWGLLGSS